MEEEEEEEGGVVSSFFFSSSFSSLVGLAVSVLSLLPAWFSREGVRKGVEGR